MPNENDDYAGEIEYRLPYLKKHVLNEESLSRLQANDPVLEHLTYSGFFDSDDWIAGTGPAIGNSDVLRMLNVSWFQLSCYRRAIQELEDFCLGLQHNRSIEYLFLRTDITFPSGPDIFQVIAPFFKYNRKLKLVDISLEDDVKSSLFRSLLSALSNCKNDQLQCFRISLTCTFTDEDAKSLIDLLKTQQTNLLELYFDHEIESWGITALANLLTYSESKIHALNLQYHEFDDEHVTILGAALVTNKTVKKLTLGETIICTPGLAGWRGFAQCLRHHNSVLEELCIECLYNDDIESIREIMSATVHNRSLKLLSICPREHEIELDWLSLSEILCNAKSIDSTFSSNHTLIDFRVGCDWASDDEDCNPYVIMNADDDDKAAVARQKI